MRLAQLKEMMDNYADEGPLMDCLLFKDSAAGGVRKAVVERYVKEVGRTKLKTVHVPGVDNGTVKNMMDADEPGELQAGIAGLATRLQEERGGRAGILAQREA